MALYGLWWREEKNDVSLISIVSSLQIKEIVLKDQNDTVLERKTLNNKSGKAVYTFHTRIPVSVHYITVNANGHSVLLMKSRETPTYALRNQLGMKLGSWIGKIGEISISFAEATIKQIDGLLYNI